MPVTKLTQRLVDDLRGAEPPTRDLFYWSQRFPGLAVKHKAGSGRVSYCIQWRDPETGRSHRLAIGDAAQLKLDKAEAAARDRFAAIAAGRNPMKERARTRSAPTFPELVDQYLASDTWKAKASSTRMNDLSRARYYFEPFFGARKVTEITEADARMLFRDLQDPDKAEALARKAGRTKKVIRGGEGGARRTMRFFKALMAFAVAEKYLLANPAAGLKLGTDTEREAILDDAAYGRFWAALEALRPSSYTMGRACDVFALCALTGARRGEVQKLRWRHVDLEARRIVLPKGEHKTGGKTGRARVISLSADAVAILAGYERGEPEAFVFAGLYPNKPVALQRPWERLAEEARLPAEVTIHGLRHGVGSLLAMAGHGEREIMEVLGHRSTRTTARYVHFANQAREALAERAAGLVRPQKLRAVT